MRKISKLKLLVVNQNRKIIASRLSQGRKYFKLQDFLSRNKTFKNLEFPHVANLSGNNSLFSDSINKKIENAFLNSGDLERNLLNSLASSRNSGKIPKKILFLLPRSLPGTAPTPNPQLSSLSAAAQNCNISFSIKYIEELVTTDLKESIVKEIEVEEFVRKEMFDLIILDMTFWQRLDKKRYFTPVNPIFVAKLQSQNINICGVLIDLYDEEDIEMLKQWQDSLDILLHSEPFALEDSRLKIRNRSIFLPYTGYLQTKPTTKYSKPSLSFSGGLDAGSRQRWLNFVLKICRANRIETHFNVFTRDYSRYNLSQGEYEQILMKSHMALNLCQKTEKHWVLTARTFDIISSGTLLLHEENHSRSALSKLYVPYLHFIPFESPAELSQIIRFLSRNPEFVRRISERGSKFHKESYTAEKLFNSMMSLKRGV